MPVTCLHFLEKALLPPLLQVTVVAPPSLPQWPPQLVPPLQVFPGQGPFPAQQFLQLLALQWWIRPGLVHHNQCR